MSHETIRVQVIVVLRSARRVILFCFVFIRTRISARIDLYFGF